jgi:hypothetical protein
MPRNCEEGFVIPATGPVNKMNKKISSQSIINSRLYATSGKTRAST